MTDKPKLPPCLISALLLAMLADAPRGLDSMKAERITDDCDCELCTQRRAAEAGAAAKETKAAADSYHAQKRSVIEGDVAALVGLTPDMLEDEAVSARTLLRLNVAEFITNLRAAMSPNPSAASMATARIAESSVMNALQAALLALGD